jgi:hypothetical protein
VDEECTHWRVVLVNLVLLELGGSGLKRRRRRRRRRRSHERFRC